MWSYEDVYVNPYYFVKKLEPYYYISLTPLSFVVLLFSA